MIYNEVERIVNTKKSGAFVNVVWEKILKTKKGVTDIIERHSEMVGRFDIDYDHIKEVQRRREEGILPQQNQGLPWGQWKNENFIEHNGQTYLRVYPVPNNRIKSRYYKNGVECTREEVRDICLASNFSNSDEEPTVLTINTNSIINIK